MAISDDTDVIDTYTIKQAIEEGVLIKMFVRDGKPVVVTTHVWNDFEIGREELVDVWSKFKLWKEKIEPTLPEEERLFVTYKDDKKIWVIEDGVAYTIMYSE